MLYARDGALAESKAFFFEKKKQKTFVDLAKSLSQSRILMNKSVLVLFFKKTLLPLPRLFKASTWLVRGTMQNLPHRATGRLGGEVRKGDRCRFRYSSAATAFGNQANQAIAR